MAEEGVKTLDTQASCHEQLGNFDEAISTAMKIVKTYKTSPVVQNLFCMYCRSSYVFRDI